MTLSVKEREDEGPRGMTVQCTGERDGKEMLKEEGYNVKVIMSGKKRCECADVKEMTNLHIHKEIKVDDGKFVVIRYYWYFRWEFHWFCL
jgi:hypothetical protein